MEKKNYSVINVEKLGWKGLFLSHLYKKKTIMGQELNLVKHYYEPCTWVSEKKKKKHVYCTCGMWTMLIDLLVKIIHGNNQMFCNDIGHIKSKSHGKRNTVLI